MDDSYFSGIAAAKEEEAKRKEQHEKYLEGERRSLELFRANGAVTSYDFSDDPSQLKAWAEGLAHVVGLIDLYGRRQNLLRWADYFDRIGPHVGTGAAFVLNNATNTSNVLDFILRLATVDRSHLQGVRGSVAQALVGISNDQFPEPDAVVPPGQPRPKQRVIAPNWTLDAAELACEDYLNKHQPQFRGLIRLVEIKAKGADQAARKIFGRNRIAKKLGISFGLVSKTKTWTTICNAFGWHKEPAGIKGKVGIGMAIDGGQRSSASAADEAEVNDLVALARSRLAESDADEFEQKLRSGEWSPQQADYLLKLAKDQNSDRLSKKVHSR